MSSTRPDLRTTILAAWRTNNRATVSLIERLPQAATVELWQWKTDGRS